MGWYGFDPSTGILYKYRDWPGNYEVPGEGVPGPWVEPSDKNDGMNDGRRGEGQTSFGFGYDHYKFEIARLEGWKDYEDWVAAGNDPTRFPEDMTVVEDWDDGRGARERIEFRLLDSRAASQSKINRGANQTLLQDLETLMSGWEVADGQRCEVGYSKLIDLCAKGQYLITEDCVNTALCYKFLTGRDGQKGAAKDFIDLDRYAVLSDVWNYLAEKATALGEAATGVAGTGRKTASRRRFGGGGRKVWW